MLNMGRVSIFISFAMCMSNIWQMCDASCGQPVVCTSNSQCREDQACLPSRNGTQTICRLCYCKEKDQCRTDPISRSVTCDCSNSDLDGPFCTCHQCTASCPPGFTQYDRTCTCYAGFLEIGDWSTSRARCIDRNATLVKITSDEENTFVRDLMKSIIIGNTFTRFWMGGNDIAAEGAWIWDSDSTPIVYTKWSLPGVNPSNHYGIEHCLEMYVNIAGHDGLWNDKACSDHFNYICEYYP